MAKKNQHAKLGFGVDIITPEESIHMGQGKRIRLEDVPEANSDGDLKVGNREYNDKRYILKGASTGGNVSRFIKGGFWVWQGVGFEFKTVLTEYLLPGLTTPIVVQPFDIDLADFPGDLDNSTNPQFVRPQWDANGNVSPLFGDSGIDPTIPEVNDPETEIAGSPTLLGAGDTQPTVLSTDVYQEHAGSEFAVTSTGSATLDAESTESVSKGTKAIKFSPIINDDTIIFTAGSDFTLADFNQLGLEIDLIDVFFAGHELKVAFHNNLGNAVSNQLDIPINKTNLGWQQVGIALQDFNFSALLAREIRISFSRKRGTSTLGGFYLDNIVLQGGIIPPVVSGDIELTGHVVGSGETGESINVTITEKAISDQTEQIDPLAGTEELLGRLSTGDLVRIPASLLFGAGTPGADGEDGREVELQNNGTHIQWRYVGDPTWTNLVALSTLVGPAGDDGADGRDPEFQVSGTDLQWRLVGDPTWTTIFDLSTLGGGSLPSGGTVGQVLTKNSSTDGDASWQDPTGGGGGLTAVAFTTALKFDKNYKSETSQTGVIAFTLDSTDLVLATHYSNRYEIEIEANGTGGIPTFSSDFEIQYSDWSNNTGDINRLVFILSKSGKIAVWIDNIISA